MRFFKAFSLLHRRTKSETFIPGYISPDHGFAVSNLHPRPSSLSAGLGSNRADSSDISSVFDFATAKFFPIPANFNHLRGTHHASNRRSVRDSQNNLSSLLVEENIRLREALNLWFSEFSKAEELLKKCCSELTLERDKTSTLQQQAARDQDLIQDLKKDIVRYEKKFEHLKNPGISNYLGRKQSLEQPTSHSPPRTLLLPGSSDSATSLVISKKIRTLDEYTSALRMTLSTRRQLRDQKKVSKFWKNIALSMGESEDIITPSTSAISSVLDPLPPERKRAIDTLMRERGWPYPQIQPAELESEIKNASSEPQPPLKVSISGDLSLSRIHPVSVVTATLLSTSSNNSLGSRLAPLASESLKAEINLFFGVQKSEKPLSSPSKKYRLGTITPSPTTLKPMGESHSRLSNILEANNPTFSFGSYGDLSQRFSNLFSQDHAPSVRLPETGVEDVRIQNSELYTRLQQSPPPSSSRLVESSVPSGSSRIFSEALALLQGQRDSDLYFNFLPDREEITKPFKSVQSWQKYIAPPAKQIRSKTGIPKKKIFAGKENAVVFSKPLSLLKK